MTTAIAQPEVKYSRAVPPVWGELVDFARAQLDPADPAASTPEMAEAMLGRFSELGNEELDSLRYYGLGLAMCGLAKALKNPDERSALTRGLASSLFDWWVAGGTTERDSLQPSDIFSGLGAPFAGLARRAVGDLPSEVQFLNDALHVEANERRSVIREMEVERRYNLSRQPEPESLTARLARSVLGRPVFGRVVKMFAGRRDEAPAEDLAAARASTYRRSSVDWTPEGGIKRDRTEEVIRLNGTAAAYTVLRLALTRRDAYTAPKSPPKLNAEGEAVPATAVEIMDEAGDALSLEAIGMRCAALRADEFRGGVGGYIDTDEHGNVVFRKDRMPKAADLEPPAVSRTGQVTLHTKRLRCPAMFVEGLIPLMMEIVPEAVRAADNMAKNRSLRIV